jgi:hypothetical protein
LQFAPCPYLWQAKDTCYVPPYFFTLIGHKVAVPTLASFAAKYHHSQCNIFDFLGEENRTAVEGYIAGIDPHLLLPRTATATGRATKALQGAHGNTWQRALGNKPHRWQGDARPGPWAPQDENDDEDDERWDRTEHTNPATTSDAWRSSGWSASGAASSTPSRPAPYASTWSYNWENNK